MIGFERAPLPHPPDLEIPLSGKYVTLEMTELTDSQGLHLINTGVIIFLEKTFSFWYRLQKVWLKHLYEWLEILTKKRAESTRNLCIGLNIPLLSQHFGCTWKSLPLQTVLWIRNLEGWHFACFTLWSSFSRTTDRSWPGDLCIAQVRNVNVSCQRPVGADGRAKGESKRGEQCQVSFYKFSNS